MREFFMTEKECEKQWDAYHDQLHTALEMLVSFDSYLFAAGQERALTNKLGTWMFQTFGNHWDVDCEYRKAGSDPKTYEGIFQQGKRTKKDGTPIQEMNLRETLDNIRAICLERDFDPGVARTLDSAAARPDVIVHQRGQLNMTQNLLMIEAKMDAGPDILDEIKLMAFTIGAPLQNDKSLRYQLGLWLDFKEMDATREHFRERLRGTRYINGYKKDVFFDLDVRNRALEKHYT